MSSRVGRRSARPPARCGSPISPNSPTPWSFSRPGGGPQRGRIATVHDSGAERALCADVAHDLGVEFAALAAEHAGRHRRAARRRPGAHQPARRVGYRRRHPRPVRRLPARVVDDPAVAVTALAVDLVTEYDGDTAYADAVLDVARTAPMPAGGARVGAVRDRPADRGTAARQRRSRARGHPQRAGGAGPPGPLAAACRRTSGARSRARQQRWRARIAAGAGSAASSCSPTTASRLSRPARRARSARCWPPRTRSAIRLP